MKTFFSGICVSTLWCFLVLTAQDAETVQTFLVDPQARIAKANLKLDVPHHAPTTSKPKSKTEKKGKHHKDESDSNESSSSSEEVITDEEYYMALPRLCCWYNGNTFNKKRCGRSVDLLPSTNNKPVSTLSRNEMAQELKSLIVKVKQNQTMEYDDELFKMVSDILFSPPLHSGDVNNTANEIQDPRSDPELRSYLKDIYDMLYARKNGAASAEKNANTATSAAASGRMNDLASSEHKNESTMGNKFQKISPRDFENGESKKNELLAENPDKIADNKTLSGNSGDSEANEIDKHKKAHDTVSGDFDKKRTDKNKVPTSSGDKAAKKSDNEDTASSKSKKHSKKQKGPKNVTEVTEKVETQIEKSSAVKISASDKVNSLLDEVPPVLNDVESDGKIVKRSVIPLTLSLIDQKLSEKQQKLVGKDGGQSIAQSPLSNFFDVVRESSAPSRIYPRYSSEEDFSGPRRYRQSDYAWGRPESNTYQQEKENQQEPSKINSEKRKTSPKTDLPDSKYYSEEPTIEFRLKSPQEIYLDAKRAEEAQRKNNIPKERNLLTSAQEKNSRNNVPQRNSPDYVPQEKSGTSHDPQEKNYEAFFPQEKYSKNQDRKSKGQAEQERNNRDYAAEEKNSQNYVAEEKRSKSFVSPERNSKRLDNSQTHINEERNFKSYTTHEKHSKNSNNQKNTQNYLPREKGSRSSTQDKTAKGSQREEFSKLTAQKSEKDLEELLFKNEQTSDNERKVREKSMDKTPDFIAGREKLAAKFPNLVNAFQTGASLNMDKLKADSRRETLVQNFLDSHPQLKKKLKLWRSDKNDDSPRGKSRTYDRSLEQGINEKRPENSRRDPGFIFDDEFKPEDYEVLKLISDLLESTSEVKATIKKDSEEEQSHWPQPRKSLLNRLWSTTTPPPLPKAPGVSYRKKEPETPNKFEDYKLESEKEKSAFSLTRVLRPMADIQSQSESADVYWDESPEEHYHRWKRSAALPNMPIHPRVTEYSDLNGYPLDAIGYSSDDVSGYTSDVVDESSASARDYSMEDPLSKTIYSYLQSIENQDPSNFFSDPYNHFLVRIMELENCLISDDKMCYEDPECRKSRLVRTAGENGTMTGHDDIEITKNETMTSEPNSVEKEEAINTKNPEKFVNIFNKSKKNLEMSSKNHATSKTKKENDQSLDKFLENFEEGNVDQVLELIGKNTEGQNSYQALDKVTKMYDHFTFYDLDSDDFDKSLLKSNKTKKEIGLNQKIKPDTEKKAEKKREAEKYEEVKQDEKQETVKPVEEKIQNANLEAKNSESISVVVEDQTQAVVVEAKPKTIEKQINDSSKSPSTEIPKSKQAEAPKSKSKPVEMPKSKLTNTTKLEDKETPKFKTEEEKAKSTVKTTKSILLTSQKPKAATSSRAQLQLPMMNWKENKNAWWDKINTNVEISKNAIKNLKQELSTSSSENKSKLSSRFQSASLLNSNQINFPKPLNFNLSEKLTELKSKM